MVAGVNLSKAVDANKEDAKAITAILIWVCGLQSRQNVIADSVAQIIVAVVGVVKKVGDVVTSQIGEDICLVGLQKGADVGAIFWLHRSQPSKASTTNQANKKSFLLVIAMVAEGNQVGLVVNSDLFQKMAPCLARQLFSRAIKFQI